MSTMHKSFKDALDQRVAGVRQLQELLNDEERMDLWREIMKGYCHECGMANPSKDFHGCYCANDE